MWLKLIWRNELCLCMLIATSCAVGRVDYVLYHLPMCHRHLSTYPPNRAGSRDIMSRREKIVRKHVERFSPDTLYHLIWFTWQGLLHWRVEQEQVPQSHCEPWCVSRAWLFLGEMFWLIFSKGKVWVLTISNSHLLCILCFLADIESDLGTFSQWPITGKQIFHRHPGWHPTARNEKGRAWMLQWRTLWVELQIHGTHGSHLIFTPKRLCLENIKPRKSGRDAKGVEAEVEGNWGRIQGRDVVGTGRLEHFHHWDSSSMPGLPCVLQYASCNQELEAEVEELKKQQPLGF